LTSITTSRDPSVRARRLGKALARFLSLSYVNRGKQSLAGEETWIVVAEKDGNPSRLVIRESNREELLEFKISFDSGLKSLKRARPVVTGPGDIERIAAFFDLDFEGDSQSPRIIWADPSHLEFVDDDQLMLELEI